MTIADALRVSSNVGIAKSAQGLTPGQQYENLRDFGFGAPTGIEIPGEATGVLRRPDAWSAQSPASLAIGYEISVTPLQMAMAYGALANGGLLMEPHLVKEVRDAEGQPGRALRAPGGPPGRGSRTWPGGEPGDGGRGRGRHRHQGAAGHLRRWPARAVPAGPTRPTAATGADTTRPSWASSPRTTRSWWCTCAWSAPRAVYYGGAVAAPVTRATMEAALAARRTPLDRARLLRSVRTPTPAASRRRPVQLRRPAHGSPGPALRRADDATPTPAIGVRTASAGRGASRRRGPARCASPARRLHALGLRVGGARIRRDRGHGAQRGHHVAAGRHGAPPGPGAIGWTDRPVTLGAVGEVLRSAGLLRDARGAEDVAVLGACQDSRSARPGDLFLAWQGTAVDAHDFVADAVAAGAVAAVVEHPVDVAVPQLVVTRRASRGGAGGGRRGGLALARALHRGRSPAPTARPPRPC